MLETIHVVYKTHLDLGFTDYPSNVVTKYMDDYIPKAIAVAKEVAAQSSTDRFVWTTGSWLIRHFLDHASPAQRAEMEDAIRAGHITWHGLPCSTHTELMDQRLAEYGLSISQSLDAEFGTTTVAAKMTDVPGHTVGLVPLLARAGLKYLHLGVNPASALPDVPAAFVWQAPDGSQIVVNYDADYGVAKPGTVYAVPGLSDALYIAHTGDNLGPPTAESVAALYALLRENYPGADIKASTLDAFAEVLWEQRGSLPVVTEEIGDSWIHGAASDPLMVARLRELMRLRDHWIEQDRLRIGSTAYNAFSDNLLLVAEHTWGMDEKTFLPDYKNYAKADFQAARARDIVDGENERSYSAFEQSWKEKRGYIDSAVASLPAGLRAEAEAALDALTPTWTAPQVPGIELLENRKLGHFTATFGADGSIISLQDAKGKTWADAENPIGAYSYETFGPGNYTRWFSEYVRDIGANQSWAVPDFGKVGMEYAVPAPRHELFRPRVINQAITATDAADVVTIHAVMPASASAETGAPRNLEISYRFLKESATIEIVLKSVDKDANRLPEASWFTIAPKVNNPNLWKLDKLGTPVSPLAVVRNGNRNLHAVGSGVHYAGSDGTVSITALDAPVVSVGRPRLLQFENTFADLAGGFHINLHNNVWGTNFTMWNDDDMSYRFIVELN